MNFPCRILHVIPQDGVGGVEVAARAMPTETQSGCQFQLLLISGRAISASPIIIDSEHDGLNDPCAHIAAARAIIRLAPDVLICSLWRSVPICLFAKLWRPRIALVMFLHLDRPMHQIDRILTRLGMMLADEIWSDSSTTLAARRLPRGKSQRVVSFVTERLLPSTNAEKVIPAPRFACWARIVPQKGFDRAITLIRALIDRGIHAHFDIWGPDGGEQRALEQQVADLDLDAHVSFRGIAPRNLLASIAADNSFFLQLSRFEGMAMSVVEGMQLGLLPVATGAGQMAHYVQNGVTGIRVDADRLNEAVDAIVSLLGDPARFKQMRENAVGYWVKNSLYADDVCTYASDLARKRNTRSVRS